VELASQGTLVVGVHVGLVDTDMTSAFDLPKVTARSVADATMEGIRNDAYEVYADDDSRIAKAKLSGTVDDMYTGLMPVRR
jgi:NAD(P)-dependent dehydrogenase (short-subunit alcohol dehydrogenase family)